MLDFIFSLLFPKRCIGCKKAGSYLCSSCFSHIKMFQDFVCPVCVRSSISGETHPSCKTPHSLDGLACAVVYKGVVKRLVYRFKYPPYVLDLAMVMGKIFVEGISQNELFMRTLSQRPIVIPIPLSSQKLRKRGYNQAEILAASLGREFNLANFTEILVRIKNTKPQFQLNKLQRSKNVKDAFRIASGYRDTVQGKTVFLIDDLATSCATLKECAKVLRRSGAKKVIGVAFAREL